MANRRQKLVKEIELSLELSTNPNPNHNKPQPKKPNSSNRRASVAKTNLGDVLWGHL